ncbi:hypothetical protein C1645_739667 [Glomus cerebriforme]|uniref:Uncharacterized protein n=1 Tax=Glomus cerebriforme TaxID=658196 RepID=A0A397ST27_9GLOM|nr:hypothetical protein C1645_739667 [Glomus cerebriforme]
MFGEFEVNYTVGVDNSCCDKSLVNSKRTVLQELIVHTVVKGKSEFGLEVRIQSELIYLRCAESLVSKYEFEANSFICTASKGSIINKYKNSPWILWTAGLIQIGWSLQAFLAFT